TPFTSQGSLYKVSPLGASAVPLLMGRIPGHAAEPVAWVNRKAAARVFYTSLGHPGDFETPAFRRLLRNAVFWALDRQPSQAARAAAPPGSDANAQAGKGTGPRVPIAAARSAASQETPSPFERGQGPLAPRAALASFRVPDDLQLELVLAEPIVRQPV